MRKFQYRLMSTKFLWFMMVLITVLYAAFFTMYPDLVAKKIPDPIVKALKFTAFILGGYTFWNAIGRDTFRQEMLVQSQNQPDQEKRQEALTQLRLLATDDHRGIVLGAWAFGILTVLAFFGEI
jgi:hypothetical protein